MESFLLWIGLYNLLGSVLLMFMHHERFANIMLRQATEMIAVPYQHGVHGRLFLWWAAGTNAFMAIVMLLALRWPAAIQREIAIAVISGYALMWLVCTIGGRGSQWGRGKYSIHVLWPAQIAWGLWGIYTLP